MTGDLGEIRALVDAIALATDAGGWPDFLACFTEDATADYGSLASGGVHEVAAAIRESQSRYQGTMNCVTSHLVQDDPAGPTGQTYVVSHHFRSEEGQAWDDCAGTLYRDRFVQTPGGWKIAERVATVLWFRQDPIQGGWLGPTNAAPGD